MSKKVIGALLAIVMVLSVFSFTVFAAGATKYETSEEYKQIWGLKTNGDKIDVVLTTNYKVGPISFKIDGVKSIDSVVLGADYYDGSTIDRAEDGTILIFPITSPDAPVEGVEMNEAVIASFTYTKDDSNSTPSINPVRKGNVNDPDNKIAVDGKLMATRLSGNYVGYSDFYAGQKDVTIYALDAEWKDEPVTPPAGGETPVLTGVNGAVVDDARGYVYGIPLETTDIKPYLSTTGFIDIVANDAGNTNGTGATINLYSDNTKATLIKSYKLVLFGDLDGSGTCDVTDFGTMEKHVTAALLIEDPVILFAADIAQCQDEVTVEAIDVTDFGTMEKHVTAAQLLVSNVRAA